MNEKQQKTTPVDQTYQTGRTEPPKSHRGLIAFLLALVIFLCGISTALGLLNIHLFRQLNDQPVGKEDALSFSRSEYDETLPQADPVCFGSLGVSGETVSTFWQQYLELPMGVYITDVTAGAAEAGLRPGDILQQFRGVPTENVQALTTLLADCREGELAELVVYRDGRQHTLSVTIQPTP